MAKQLKKSKTVKVEKIAPRKPQGIPLCPMHGLEMVYQPEHMYWECPDRQCAQVAFHREEIAEGTPIMGRGTLELLLMDDPDGSKMGRFILRCNDNNVMIDVTDALTNVPEANKRGAWALNLLLHHTADTRTEK